MILQKGPVVQTVIMRTKQTSSLIPMCHLLTL
ncbi:MAG TPA: hypothetical protein ENN12_00940 [Epsilonproteobacteria bacterium]|nr:hypothetical protein [Campylobacterota bacterium]